MTIKCVADMCLPTIFLIVTVCFIGIANAQNTSCRFDAQAEQTAANKGDHISEYNLGLMYERDECVAKDERQARLWFARAQEHGNSFAAIRLAWMKIDGRGGTKDVASGVSTIRDYARRGFADAKTAYGILLMDGTGIPRDAAAAVALWQEASNHGDVLAMHNLARAYMGGVGIQRDVSEALRLYEAAGKSYQASAAALCEIYIRGNDVTMDYGKAEPWCRRGAFLGHRNSRFLLGTIYWRGGTGVKRNPAEASKWLHKAAEDGSVEAQYMLGIAYLSGSLGRKDKEQARIWLQQAAQHGSELARTELNNIDRR
jgi:uncharacterized protein